MSELPPSELQPIAVLAAWCNSSAHLAAPQAEVFLAQPEHQEFCARIAERIAQPSPATTRSQTLALAAAHGSPAEQQWQHQAAAEVSQRSVDILLSNYYKMVTKNKQANKGLPKPGLFAKLFLVICPETPNIIHIRTLVKTTSRLLDLLALTMVHLDFIVLPAWLYLIRQLVQQQQMVQAVEMVLMGVVLALLAGIVNRCLHGRKQAKREGRVTPSEAALRLLPPPLIKAPLAPINTGKPQLQSTLSARGLITAAVAAPSSKVSAGDARATLAASHTHAAVPGEFQVLANDLAALQKAVYGKASRLSSLRHEVISDEICKICKEIGVKFNPENVKSYGAMKRTLQELRRIMGC